MTHDQTATEQQLEQQVARNEHNIKNIITYVQNTEQNPTKKCPIITDVEMLSSAWVGMAGKHAGIAHFSS